MSPVQCSILQFSVLPGVLYCGINFAKWMLISLSNAFKVCIKRTCCLPGLYGYPATVPQVICGYNLHTLQNECLFYLDNVYVLSENHRGERWKLWPFGVLRALENFLLFYLLWMLQEDTEEQHTLVLLHPSLWVSQICRQVLIWETYAWAAEEFSRGSH